MSFKSGYKIAKRVLGFAAILALVAGVLPGLTGCTSSPATPSPTASPTPQYSPLPAKSRLRVATTTSLYDTGLWSYLEPMFEKQYNLELDVISIGSTQAMTYGKNGDVDVVTVHDKPNEEKFIADGYGKERVPFAYNYFLIVGPASDPAGIKGMSPEDAFKKLMTSGSGTFVSRGDLSGTHAMEQRIWTGAGYNYDELSKANYPWYILAAQGMGATLTMANEKKAYTLTDMGTFISYKSKLELVPIVDKGSILLNVYSVVTINPDKVKSAKTVLAQNLVTFLISPEIQDLMGKYGVKDYGLQLFTPCAGNEPKS
ncbi:MAG: substrate-binding domain-containing protein [Chloroflexota bacterium]